jgi:type I restriction enzyme S subunit
MSITFHLLPDICEVIMGQSPPGDTYNESGVGLPFFQGKSEFGDLNPIPHKWCSAPRKTAEVGDILLSVRAPVGPTNIADRRCCIGRGLAALRAKNEIVLPDYLRYAIKYFEPKLASMGQGSTFEAISKADLHSLLIPIRDLRKQAVIVQLMMLSEEIISLRKASLKKIEEFIPSLFLDIFGNIVINEKNWKVESFSSVGTLDRGKSRHRPRDAAHLYGGRYPFIQTGDVANCGGLITTYSNTYSEEGLAQSRLWDIDTLCITIAANIAKTGILKIKACFPDSVVGFTADKSKVTNRYVQTWLSFLQPILEANAPQAAQKNINLQILRELPIPVPPLELQNLFEEKVTQINLLRLNQIEAINKSNDLFYSLLFEYFSSPI